MSDSFFSEIKEQSIIKTAIVTKYFFAWAKIIGSRSEKLAYIDLFCGPGRYEDGTKSTPLQVLEHIIADDALSEKVVTFFNDRNEEFASNLQIEIEELDGTEALEYQPEVRSGDVDEELVEFFSKTSLVPTFAFVDPWGYKGLSTNLIHGLTKDWGSDCVFFFNYNRINMGIDNPIVKGHMNSIFGDDIAESLRNKVRGMSPEEREITIVNALAESLSNHGANYVLPFRFARENGRTSHYLVFVSKHELGYRIMKEIMWKSSSDHEDGVANFSYVPYIPVEDEQLELIFSYSRPLDQLGDVLLRRFTKKRLTVEQIYKAHNIGTPYVLANYKEALKRLESEGKIRCEPPAESRPKRKGEITMSDKVCVIFP